MAQAGSRTEVRLHGSSKFGKIPELLVERMEERVLMAASGSDGSDRSDRSMSSESEQIRVSPIGWAGGSWGHQRGLGRKTRLSVLHSHNSYKRPPNLCWVGCVQLRADLQRLEPSFAIRSCIQRYLV